jgi:hypothetical protein
MKRLAIGLMFEAVAAGIAYSQFRLLGRAAIYAAFYTWPINLAIEPLLTAAGLSNKGVLFAVLMVMLFLLNSLKWTGCLLLRQSGYRNTAVILLTLLAISVVWSFSLKEL